MQKGALGGAPFCIHRILFCCQSDIISFTRMRSLAYSEGLIPRWPLKPPLHTCAPANLQT
jgi:hypothetical protein